MTDSHFIRCECSTEMLEVSRFPDDDETYLSFWYYGDSGGKYRWRRRLAVCWKVLRDGRGHPDHLVFGPKQVAELRVALGDKPTGSSISVVPMTLTNFRSSPPDITVSGATS